MQESESAKAQLSEINALTSQCDAYRRNEADLKVREKALQMDMKKKGDLARQMLSEKDALIQQLMAGSSSTGNGNGSSSSININGSTESSPNPGGSNGERSERRPHSSDPRASAPKSDGGPGSVRPDPSAFQVLALIETASLHGHW